MAERAVPVVAWPIVANVAEASGLLGLPYGVMLPGLTLGASRTVPPVNALPTRGVVLGESTYPGSGRPLVMSPEDRLRHTYVLGVTGVGKSHLLASMVLQEVSQGFGGLVIDPKADLIDAIVSRLAEKDRERTVVLDPADTAMPIGTNPLMLGGTEQQRELAAETTVTILRSIFRAYWGPRTDDLARAAVNSLTQVPAPNGSAFTLSEVAEVLTNARLRHYVSSHPRLDERWRDYWQWYNSLSEGERLNAIGPVLNKLRSFTTRTSLRLMFGQSNGFDLMRIFTERKLVLVPLARGEIGAEAAALFGAFVTGALWHATTRRASVPADQRRPAFAYLDEFQNVVRFTDDIADMAAEARGLGLGLTLANQYLSQLPSSVRAAVLGTVRSHVFFQVEHDDARLLGERLAPTLAASDLSGLGRFEIIARLNLGGQTYPPMTGRTLPLPEPTTEPAELRRKLAAQWGVPRAEVEVALRARRLGDTPPPRLGEMPSEELS
ncbi:type IV secretory system conjugative DNA transfer family protein [Amycolatopsis sp. CA-126428]|uniref:type IV secretory system conjugative DNA transfer family protein n=1 Tax=Amycolatopsis sp. CA-126428 TaxID=2073158 RepID=UPI0011B06B54|nr:DUF87 domain-containing protein [Amycolatopsis sp. CA-126428]